MSKKKGLRRVLLKLSGESFSGDSLTLSAPLIHSYACNIRNLRKEGFKFAVVVGGGNIFRGASGQKRGFTRRRGDRIGMQGTIVNALALEDLLLQLRVPTHVLGALGGSEGVLPFDARVANEYLDKGDVVIFGGGTGNPFFSTDTAAVLRALEIQADAVLKATNVNGVYDSDPNKDKRAKMFSRIGWEKALELGLKVMDLTAFSLASEHKMPIVVFNMGDPKNLGKVVRGGNVGTRVGASKKTVLAGS